MKPARDVMLPCLVGLSLLAALVHASVVEPHLEKTTLAALFIVTAGFQAVWAVALVGVLNRLVLMVGAVANTMFAGAWILTRFVGLPTVEGLHAAKSVDPKGAVAAGSATLIVVGCVWLLCTAGRAPAGLRTSRRVRGGALVGLAVFVAGLPVLFTGHNHDHHHDPPSREGAPAAEHGHEHVQETDHDHSHQHTGP